MKAIKPEFYVEISQYIDYVKWDMRLNITYICERAGLRDKWYDRQGNSHTYIPFTLTHARKIFRLIKNYADEGVILNTALYIKRYSRETGNIRILEQWEKA